MGERCFLPFRNQRDVRDSRGGRTRRDSLHVTVRWCFRHQVLLRRDRHGHGTVNLTSLGQDKAELTQGSGGGHRGPHSERPGSQHPVMHRSQQVPTHAKQILNDGAILGIWMMSSPRSSGCRAVLGIVGRGPLYPTELLRVVRDRRVRRNARKIERVSSGANSPD